MCSSEPDTAAVALKDKRVLVVEDQPLIAMLIEDHLLNVGVRIVGPAGSVRDALRLIEATASDGGLHAAVLDIELGGEHVSPVADRLAALGVPFLFATGCGEGADTGGHSAPILMKPFDLDELTDSLRGLAPIAAYGCRASGAAS